MIGQTISHYKILEELGRGGMGVVYKARDTRLDRFVAIKVLPPHLGSDPEATQRFIHEAKAASALNHPNIGVVHEIDRTDDGQTFMVMALYEGESLRDRIDRGGLDSSESLEIAGQIAAGLARAHEREIVHRDIKPSNILITRDNHVVIIDFGLAKLRGQTKITKEGSTIGTAAYMSPEQAMGEEVDHRSDIFSLGTILYEMLAGQPPFKGEHEASLLYEIVHEEPKPVSMIRPGLPEGTEQVLARCLSKDPAGRYQTDAELHDGLQGLKEEMREAVSGTRTGEPAKTTRKSNKRWLWAVPIIIIAALIIIWSPWDKPDEAEQATGTITPKKPNWILVADFDGPNDNPELAMAVRDLVIATLNESRLVRPLSRSDLKRGLALAMKPDTTRVKGEIAQELAYRAGARVYIEGSITRMASGFSIVLNVMDAETGGYVLPVAGMAENDNAVIPTVDRLVRELREKIGENKAAVESTRETVEIITPSFEAYLEGSAAQRLQREMNYRESQERAEKALELDPDFAAAWISMGYGYFIQGKDQKSRYAFEEALKRPDRLTEEARLAAEAFVAGFLDWELSDALDKWTQLVRRYNRWHSNRGVILAYMGRLEEAYEMDRVTVDIAPFGPTNILLYNLASSAIALGRYEETLETINRIQAPGLKAYCEIWLASALFEWKRADSIAAIGPLWKPQRGAKYLASRDVSRGSIRSAMGRYEELWDDEYPDFNYHTCMWTLQLSRITRLEEIFSSWPVCSDTSMFGLVIEGVRAASHGDTVLTQSILDHIRTKPDYSQRQFMADIAFVEACLEAEKGHLDEVIRILEPIAYKGRYAHLRLRWPMRWLVAEAYEKQGNPEKAAEFFELVLSHSGISDAYDYLARASYCAFAHHRLALLYSLMGKTAEAEKHLIAFEELFTDPDPELEWMLEEAREAINKIGD